MLKTRWEASGSRGLGVSIGADLVGLKSGAPSHFTEVLGARYTYMDMTESTLDDPGIELVEVWRASGETNAQIIRSLLESYGIESLIEGESLRLTHGFTLNTLGLARILVRAEDAEQARDLLTEQIHEDDSLEE